MSSPLRGKTIAVIGAGPAGATVAFLLARSRRNRILLFDQRSLLDAPVAGNKLALCGGCGGLIQAGVMSRLRSLDLGLPAQIMQDDLQGYAVHYPRRHATFEIPAPGMVSVYRGWGPVRGETPCESFDSFLVRQASAAGAEFHCEQVRRIQLGDGRSSPAVITTDVGQYAADFVIGAFGHAPKLFSSIVDGAQRPAHLDTCRVSRGAVREYEFGSAFVEHRYQGKVHVVADATERIWFAALIPKQGIVTIVLMGRDNIRPSDFDEFFAIPSLRGLLPSANAAQDLMCACSRSSLTTSSSRHFLIPGSGGIALIGDAGPTRPRKNGLFAAIDLAQELASCIDQDGFGSRALRGFQHHAWTSYVVDNIWADTMLSLSSDGPGIPILGSLAMRSLARGNNTPVITSAMREYARLMLTGESSYWRIPVAILKKMLGP